MKTHKIGNKSFKSSSRYNENRGVVIVWSGNSCGDELIKTAKKDQFGRLIDTKGSHFTVHYLLFLKHYSPEKPLVLPTSVNCFISENYSYFIN